MAIALIAIVPLACRYGLAKNFLHPTLMQFAVTSVLALGYMLLGARWILVRNTRYPRPAPQV
jgi:hypothetical protein